LCDLNLITGSDAWFVLGTIGALAAEPGALLTTAAGLLGSHLHAARGPLPAAS
jgi:hypothetical protein